VARTAVPDGDNRMTGIIVQARMGSQRLPGKSLLPLAGKPLLWHVLTRCAQASAAQHTVLATGVGQENDPLAALAAELGIACFRGHDTDLAQRFHDCAAEYGITTVVRVCADNPLVHPGELDRLIAHHMASGEDYSCNVVPFMGNGYPDGIGGQAFPARHLASLLQESANPSHREHMVTFFTDQPQRFRCGSPACPREFARPDIRLDINTPAEYEFIARLFAELWSPERPLTMREIIPWCDAQRAAGRVPY
ncbi:MAG TPA: NTP transferase domain-containing protein, partial [bacterium]|nr:NTP transferase domain-containing protein [bacterium]